MNHEKNCYKRELVKSINCDPKSFYAHMNRGRKKKKKLNQAWDNVANLSTTDGAITVTDKETSDPSLVYYYTVEDS